MSKFVQALDITVFTVDLRIIYIFLKCIKVFTQLKFIPKSVNYVTMIMNNVKVKP